MDVTQGVLRVKWVRIDETLGLLSVVVHHAVTDGWSLGVLVRELWTVYGNLRDDPSLAADRRLPVLPVQFVDYAHWQREIHGQGEYEEHLAYWRQQLESPVPVLAISEVRTGAGQTAAASRPVVIEAELVDALKRLARANKTSINVVLLTAYAMTLGRESGQDELLIQVPLAGRERVTEGLIGSFADAIVLRLDLSPGADLADLVRSTHTQLYDGIAHAVPLALLLQGVALKPAETLKLHRAILHWEQTVNLRRGNQGSQEGLLTKPFVPGEMERAQLAAQTQSVLNINAADDGSMRGDWLFSEAAIAPELMTRLVTRFHDQLQGFISPADAAAAPVEAPRVEESKSPVGLKSFSSRALFGSTK